MVVPAYEAEAFLGETLDGILAQTLPPARVVVVDDGSGDRTAEIARARGTPVHVVRQENRGVSEARNRGVSETTAPFVAFCDADDVWLPEKLERQMRALEADPDAVAAFCGAVVVGPEGRERETKEGPEHRTLGVGDLLRHREGRTPVGVGSSLLARRSALEAVGPWDPGLSQIADWDYAIRLRMAGGFTGPREALLRYRWHESAMSRSVDLLARDTRRLFEKLERDERVRSRWGRDLRDARAWNWTVIAASYRRVGRRGAALRWLGEAAMRDPAALLRALAGRGKGVG